MRITSLILLALPLVAGCKTRLWELPTDAGVPDLATPPPPDLASATPPDFAEARDLATAFTATCRQDNPGDKVDLLFLIDNSRSMDAMQLELRKRFGQFFSKFADLARNGTNIDLHVGVVTSDYGAGPKFTGGCDPSPGGQRGRLQALGAAADPKCKPPVGASYLSYVFDGVNPGPNNLPQGQDLVQTFTCMASVGAKGCGIEHVLESVYAALHDDIPENKGFLRDDAVLAVVFLTNEDDCSAPPDTDLFDPAKADLYGANASYRCTRFGVVCGNPPRQPPYDSSHGPLLGCVPAPNPNGAGPGKLYDVSRYTDFFTRPAAQGGIKTNPFDVLLVGIAGPPQPFETVLAYADDTDWTHLQCDRIDQSCLPTLERSCQNVKEPWFYGDPAVRLDAVISAAANHGWSPICSGDYSSALENIANLIVAQLGECCIPERLPPDPNAPNDPDKFLASCEVVQVTQHDDGTTTTTPIPACAQSPAPCWRLAKKDQCAAQSPQSVGVLIDRDGIPAPLHSVVRATCLVEHH